MIAFRLKTAGYNGGPAFFTDDAINEIHRYTQGYPRQISLLCHNALKTLVMESKPEVDGQIIRQLIARDIR